MSKPIQTRSWPALLASGIAVAFILGGVWPLAPVSAAIGLGLAWKKRGFSATFLIALIVLVISIAFLLIVIDTNYGSSGSSGGSTP